METRYEKHSYGLWVTWGKWFAAYPASSRSKPFPHLQPKRDFIFKAEPRSLQLRGGGACRGWSPGAYHKVRESQSAPYLRAEPFHLDRHMKYDEDFTFVCALLLDE